MSLQYVVEQVLTPVGTAGDEVIYLCPKCNDKSGHLYVNYKRGKYNCVRCGNFKGNSISNLVRTLGLDPGYDYESLDDGDYDSRLDEILSITDKELEVQLTDYSVDLDALNMYYDLHTKPLTVLGYNYLTSRGLPQSVIQHLQFREGVNHYGECFTINGKHYNGRDYSGRIMIPSLRKDGTISFYLARDYTGTKKAKYSNAPQELAYSSEDVWNLDITDSNDIIICEGVMTAIAVNLACGNQVAVATYGKTISSKSNGETKFLKPTSQGEKLLNKKYKTYYVFYDYDAVDNAIDTSAYLYDRGAHVKVVRIPEALADKYGSHADANDMTKDEVLACLGSAVDYNRLAFI